MAYVEEKKQKNEVNLLLETIKTRRRELNLKRKWIKRNIEPDSFVRRIIPVDDDEKVKYDFL